MAKLIAKTGGRFNGDVEFERHDDSFMLGVNVYRNRVLVHIGDQITERVRFVVISLGLGPWELRWRLYTSE